MQKMNNLSRNEKVLIFRIKTSKIKRHTKLRTIGKMIIFQENHIGFNAKNAELLILTKLSFEYSDRGKFSIQRLTRRTRLKSIENSHKFAKY